MKTKLKDRLKSQRGFTIIEVLIVLAIAALILLIVFLAVPALQRNSRNTQRNNDVASILAAATQASNNNNGALVINSCGTSNPFNFITQGNCTTTTSVRTEFSIGYYTARPAVGDGSTTAQGPLATDIAQVWTGAKCDPANNGKTQTGSTRQVAVLYMFEPNSTLTPTCKDS